MLKSEGKRIAENRHLPWAALQCDLSARLDFISRSIYNSTPHWVLTGIYSLLSRFSTSVWCNVNGSYWFTEDWITVWWVRCCQYYAVSDDNTVDWESYRSQCLQDQSFRGFAQSAVSQIVRKIHNSQLVTLITRYYLHLHRHWHKMNRNIWPRIFMRETHRVKYYLEWFYSESHHNN